MATIHKLDDAANFLMLVSDETPGLTNTCNISPKAALDLLQPLHALIDKEIQVGKHPIADRHIKLCETNCHCGVYSDMAQNQYLKDDLFKKAQEFPKKKLLACAQKTALWFCKDQLLDNLKSDL